MFTCIKVAIFNEFSIDISRIMAFTNTASIFKSVFLCN
ncbi:hypothetical protein [Flavonifractor phage Chenonceau]|nr:hypothetical protein [Flavonifractor phage Chenonceau]DAZ70651.1 MAG TPA: hypothetical protein [Caudoviricetes sp.]